MVTEVTLPPEKEPRNPGLWRKRLRGLMWLKRGQELVTAEGRVASTAHKYL